MTDRYRQGMTLLVVLRYVVLLASLAPFALQAAETSGLRPVSLQLKWSHQWQFAGYYAALQQGYYREAGLDVTLLEIGPGLSPLDQLLSGQVDFAVSDTGALIYRSTGSPVVALAAIFQHSPSILLSTAASGIDAPVKLENRRVMLSGGHTNAELMAMLGSAGLQPDDFMVVPSDTDVDVLLSGGVDAYNGYTTNEVYLLEQRGIPFHVFHPRDYGVDFYGDVLLTTGTLLQSDPGLVAAFRTASLKGWEYAIQHPEEIVDLILSEYNSAGKSREHLLFEARQSIQLILAGIVPVGYMSAERWEGIAAVFGSQGLLQREVEMDSFLYQEDRRGGLIDLLRNYRIELGILGSALAAIFLAFHIFSLRRLVSVRTLELQGAIERAEAEARTDPLTGLPNRRHFMEGLSRDLAQAKRYGLPLAFMSIDIDHFKLINDRFGHATGDEALRQIGRIMLTQCRTGDLTARIGGEEFAFASLNMNLAEAQAYAERLRELTASRNLKHEGELVSLTLSIGICMCEGEDSIASLFSKADSALYAAKAKGRDRVCIWQAQ